MATINAQVPDQPQQADLAVAAFWDNTYWPFVQENLKPSTYLGCQQVNVQSKTLTMKAKMDRVKMLREELASL
jgi:hypothetical protein